MSSHSIKMNDELLAYVHKVSLREHPELARLRQETASLKMAVMQICPEQGQLMQMLVRMMGAERAIEVGVFTGYSALAVALAMPKHGEIVACDVHEEWTSMGKKAWNRAKVGHKIDLRLAPALDTLNALIQEGRAGQFDFAFIDADKTNYMHYYERILTLLRPGGVVAIDNVLWSGKVATPSPDDSEDTLALRALNTFIHADERVHISMLSIGDGLTIAQKKSA